MLKLVLILKFYSCIVYASTYVCMITHIHVCIHALALFLGLSGESREGQLRVLAQKMEITYYMYSNLYHYTICKTALQHVRMY